MDAPFSEVGGKPVFVLNLTTDREEEVNKACEEIGHALGVPVTLEGLRTLLEAGGTLGEDAGGFVLYLFAHGNGRDVGLYAKHGDREWVITRDQLLSLLSRLTPETGSSLVQACVCYGLCFVGSTWADRVQWQGYSFGGITAAAFLGCAVPK